MLLQLLFLQAFEDKGWHFYNEGQSQQEEPPKTLEEFKEKTKKALEEAIWDPSPTKVLCYLRLQKIYMDKGQKFSDVWIKTMRQHPDLDNTVKHPTAHYGVSQNKLRETKENKRLLDKSKSKYYLLLFVSDNHHSKIFKDAVLDMAKQQSYQVQVIDVSEREEVLKQWQVKSVPALLLMNVETEHFTILSYSVIAADEIEKRIVQAIEEDRS